MLHSRVAVSACSGGLFLECLQWSHVPARSYHAHLLAQGAVDDLDRVLAILEETGYREERFYIHCDGALFGLMVRCVNTHIHLPA